MLRDYIGQSFAPQSFASCNYKNDELSGKKGWHRVARTVRRCVCSEGGDDELVMVEVLVIHCD